tara:strand:+ start:221 stop:937 length:717 start_codon:yes stop_codon:yes gene_type:complete
MIHLITYGNKKFSDSKKRLCNEAKATNWFDTITVYGPEDLDDEFTLKFKNILEQPRGGGYWIWKSYIIKKKLYEINDSDILIYLDAGCSINPQGKDRFNEYVEMLNNSDAGIISFQMDFPEKTYTTKEIFNYFNVDINSEIANSGQIQATVRIMKKNKNLINLINLESKTLYDNPLLFTDHYNNNQESYFKDNRHDQSIFSVIRKMYNPILLTDETYFLPFGNDKSLKYPFWATRKRK